MVPQGSFLGACVVFLIYASTTCFTRLCKVKDDHQFSNYYHLQSVRFEYSSDVDQVALENYICREVRVANKWYRNNRMIENETKHQAIV